MKKPNRTLRVEDQGDWILLIEREAYIQTGGKRRKWFEDRVQLTREELAKLAREYPPDGSATK